MSRCPANVPLRLTPEYETLSVREKIFCSVIMVPVYCACLIAAIGKRAGLRHVVFMQFDQDAATEGIHSSFNIDDSILSADRTDSFIR